MLCKLQGVVVSAYLLPEKSGLKDIQCKTGQFNV